MYDILLPHPELKNIVRAYLHTRIDFSKGNISDFHFCPATHKKFIVFYLNNSIKVKFDNGKTEKKKDMILIGPITKSVEVYFEQSHRLIAIELHNTGQFHILKGCPINTITDCNIDGDAIFGSKVNELIEKLSETLCPEAIKKELDSFFREQLKNSDKYSSPIDKLLNELPQQKSISELAFSAGISMRQLERVCKNKIGMSPSFYKKLRRFATAYRMKENNPKRNWTEIAYSCNYFDQMHLIRDFRLFARYNPRSINEILNIQYPGYMNYRIPESD